MAGIQPAVWVESAGQQGEIGDKYWLGMYAEAYKRMENGKSEDYNSRVLFWSCMFCHPLCFLNQNDYLWSKNRWFLAVDGSYFFLKTAVDGSFSNFHVTSKCLNRTSRYYIKTSVHSYFNIIKRSITLKCPTNLPHFSVITDQITKVITYNKLLHRWNIVTIEFHLSKLYVSNIRISGCH